MYPSSTPSPDHADPDGARQIARDRAPGAAVGPGSKRTKRSAERKRLSFGVLPIKFVVIDIYVSIVLHVVLSRPGCECKAHASSLSSQLAEGEWAVALNYDTTSSIIILELIFG